MIYAPRVLFNLATRSFLYHTFLVLVSINISIMQIQRVPFLAALALLSLLQLSSAGSFLRSIAGREALSQPEVSTEPLAFRRSHPLPLISHYPVQEGTDTIPSQICNQRRHKHSTQSHGICPCLRDHKVENNRHNRRLPHRQQIPRLRTRRRKSKPRRHPAVPVLADKPHRHAIHVRGAMPADPSIRPDRGWDP